MDPMVRTVAALDQNFIIDLADTAVAMHRGQPVPPKWMRVLNQLHEAVNVRHVLSCPETEFTEVESETGRNIRERNNAINHELAGGLRFRHWVTVIQTQIAIKIVECFGKVPAQELLGIKDAVDRRVFFESTSNPPLADPALKNLVFRVHWVDDKYGRSDPDLEAMAFRARLTREAMSDARVISPRATWEDHTDSVALYFLASGPTFQNVYTRWLKVKGEYDPLDDDISKRMLATHRALYPRTPFGFYGALLPPLAWEPPDVSRTDRGFVDLIKSGQLRSVPAFECWGKLMHRMREDVRGGRLPTANDIYDILRAAVMVPVCGAYATDRYMKTLLTQTNLAGGTTVRVFDQSDEDVAAFLAWADSLK